MGKSEKVYQDRSILIDRLTRAGWKLIHTAPAHDVYQHPTTAWGLVISRSEKLSKFTIDNLSEAAGLTEQS